MPDQKPDPTSHVSMASATFGTIGRFDFDVDDFESWVDTFNSYLLANELNPTTDEEKCRAIFLSSVGLKTYTLLKNLVSPEMPSKLKLKDLLQTLTSHFAPTPKAIAERYKFMGRKQQAGETATQFMAELRKLAIHCKFDDLDVRLRDQFIFGLSSEQAQRTLFTKPDDIKLKEVIAAAVAQETAVLSTTLVRGPPITPADSVNQVKRESPPRQGSKSKPKNSNPQHHARNSRSNHSNSMCPNCGSNRHTKTKDCPHKNVECHSCGKKGHFAKMCRSSSNNQVVQLKKVRTGAANIYKTDRVIKVTVRVNNVLHDMELDTGCERSLLSEKFWRSSLSKPKLSKSNVVFRTYTNEIFKPLGNLKTSVVYHNQIVEHEFPVGPGSSLFGRDLLSKFKIDWSNIASQCNGVEVSQSKSTVQSLLKEFEDVFSAPTDKISSFKAKIVLKKEATPKFLKARPIPFAVREQVDRELDMMEKTGVLEKIQHSDWASPLVIVPKSNGRVRITGDFKHTVNSQLCINQYPLAVPDELFASVAVGSKFSKLDGTNAYHQIEVDDSSKKFLVINTHRGLYRYNVLPQGIASSPAIFQEFMDQLLQGIPHAGSYIDDGICSGKTDEEHLHSLRTILQRMRSCNYKLCKDKCEFFKSKITFLGHVISSDGIHTHSDTVKAIEVIQYPRSVTELKSFLGLVNFYSKFVPFLADICEPLYKLTRDNVPWSWSKQCSFAVDTVKSKLMTSPVLAHFDPKLPLGISCDASSKGLGVVLYHKNGKAEHPIAYASKMLSPAETKYSQIEKEGLSIVFGIKKFFKYLCGREFTLVTDHKPLLAIFGPKSQLQSYVATRLHHWQLFLSQFQYNVVYRSTHEHGNADALSRCNTAAAAEINDVEACVNFLVSETIDVLPVTASQIRNSTKRDPVLSQVSCFMDQGWPSKLTADQSHLQPYFVRRTELSLVQGVLLWGTRVVVPPALRKPILEQLHSCHFGIVRMKSMARSVIWWPGVDCEIEQMCRSCLHCNLQCNNPPSQPLHPWQFPEKPWQRLHIDLAGPFQKQMWFLVMDAHSKWPEVFPMQNNTTSRHVISKLLEIFGRFGTPEQIVSDNGRQFVSEEFSRFLKVNGIRHTTSSVYHPRSNGEIERFVQTFKRGMSSTQVDCDVRLQNFLLQYRITPHSTTGASPSELLQGRKIRTPLDLVRPSVQQQVSASQDRQCKSFNTKAKSRSLHVGQQVWVQTFSKNEAKWSQGVVTKQIGPVTYCISISDKQYKRHVDHIRAAAELEPTVEPLEEAEISPSETSSADEYQTPVSSPTRSQTPVPSPTEVPDPTQSSGPSAATRPKRNVHPISRFGYSSM